MRRGRCIATPRPADTGCALTDIREVADPVEAAAVLRAGGLAIVPTETVYGLAADATNVEAVARIYAAKGRPDFNPLICHVADRAMADRLGELDVRARTLIEAFWPGPLTIVVPLKAETGIAPAVTAGLFTVALRRPVGVMGKIAAALGRPIAAPSANLSGAVSATARVHLVPLLERLEPKRDVLVAGEAGGVGLESTIVALDGAPRLLRAGGIPGSAIETVLGARLAEAGEGVRAPGMLASHYAPNGSVRLNVRSVGPDEFLIAFGQKRAEGRPRGMFQLSEAGDLDEAARNLFDALHAANRVQALRIAVEPIPSQGIGEAINDRLRRAAAPR